MADGLERNDLDGAREHLDANTQLGFIDLNVNNHAKEIKDAIAKLSKADEEPAAE